MPEAECARRGAPPAPVYSCLFSPSLCEIARDRVAFPHSSFRFASRASSDGYRVVAISHVDKAGCSRRNDQGVMSLLLQSTHVFLPVTLRCALWLGLWLGLGLVWVKVS